MQTTLVVRPQGVTASSDHRPVRAARVVARRHAIVRSERRETATGAQLVLVRAREEAAAPLRRGGEVVSALSFGAHRLAPAGGRATRMSSGRAIQRGRPLNDTVISV